MVVAGELQAQHAARADTVGTHPLGGKLAPFAWPHIPFLGVVNRNPGSPGVGRSVDAKPTKESAVGIEFRGRYLLPPVVTPSGPVVGDTVPQATSLAAENGRPAGTIRETDPSRLAGRAAKELVGSLLENARDRHAHEHKTIGCRVGARVVVGHDIHVRSASGVVHSVLNKNRIPELREGPGGPAPGGVCQAEIVRILQSRLRAERRDVSYPNIGPAAHMEHAARLLTSLATTGCVETTAAVSSVDVGGSGHARVDIFEEKAVRRHPDDPRVAHAALGRQGSCHALAVPV